MSDRSDFIATVIVDDEPLARENLRHALVNFPRWKVVGECESAAQARERLSTSRPDVVFLDVQMPRENGLGLARTLATMDEPPVIVFVTAFEKFALTAFELHALDYLLKPFDDERLKQAVTRAEGIVDLRERAAYGQALRGYVADLGPGDRAVETYLQKLSVRSVGHIESVRVADILWISAAGNYVELHLDQRTVLHRVTISQLEQRLDPAVFLRVHRSAMVRRDQCSALSVAGDGVYALALRDGTSVGVSERYVEGVRAVLQA